jgi:hypothetical protein
MPIVREFQGNIATETALHALGSAPGVHEGQYVCVGDCIDTDEQVRAVQGSITSGTSSSWQYTPVVTTDVRYGE